MGTKIQLETARVTNADCDCDIFARVCDADGNCCNAGQLDNPKIDDFEKGEVNTFSGSRIGQCNMFQIGRLPLTVKVTHGNTDGWRGQWLRVHFLNNKMLHCPIRRWIDDDESMTLSCTG